jgi:hypothetical protein
MPTNLLKVYSALLELFHSNLSDNILSIRKVFDRDFVDNTPVSFKGKHILPSPAEGQNTLDRLFSLLTTVVDDKETKKRYFESDRAIRIHWIVFQINSCKECFYLKDEDRIYILDNAQRYVVILQPLRNGMAYYLLTAYHLRDSSYRKICKKRARSTSI